MASLNLQQPFVRTFSLPNGERIMLHIVKLLNATGDTLTVPPLADPSNAGRSAAQLRRLNDVACTISTSGANTITFTGTAGSEVWVVSRHNSPDTAS